MGVRVSFNPEAFSDLPREECVERILPVSKRIDCSSHRLPFRARPITMTSISGAFPAKLLLAGANLDVLAAPRRSSVSQLRRGP
jgi:hypothetical protein